MNAVNEVVPLIEGVVEKALKDAGKPDTEIADLKAKIANICLTDKELVAKIEELGAGAFPRLRSAVRPLITYGLTLAFIFLVVFPIGWPSIAQAAWWDKIFTPFMAVFNILLGFWFGERAALKVPGKQE